MAADFFQPDQTYQRGRWTFQCLAVDTAPWDSELRAVGFLIRTDGTGSVHGMTTEDWTHRGWVLAPATECTGCGRTVGGRGLVRDEHDPECPSLAPPF